MIAFLILAHHEPALLARLARRLRAPWARTFVHVDAKVDIRPFSEALKDTDGVTFIRDRFSVYWGGWSQVEATLRLIDGAIQSGENFSHFVLLSGACYPVRDLESVRVFLERNEGEYISMTRVPNLSVHKPLSRLSKRYVEGGERAVGIRAASIRLANRIMRRMPERNVKRRLRGLVPHAGSQWWALSAGAVEAIRRFVIEQPEITRFFRHTYVPDESFFHTVLANSSHAPRIRRNLTHVDWSNPREQPASIRHTHLQDLQEKHYILADDYGYGPVFFARKFGAGNTGLLDTIDANV